jgi:hypothetical protein
MKLKLRLEDLQVDAFQTMSAPAEGGTVWGQQCTCDTACTCPGSPSCDQSCDGTCGATCDEGLSCFPTCRVSCVTCDYLNPSCVYTNCFSFAIDPQCM